MTTSTAPTPLTVLSEEEQMFRDAVADFAVSASRAKPAGSFTARSARIFRSRATPFFARPAMNLL